MQEELLINNALERLEALTGIKAYLEENQDNGLDALIHFTHENRKYNAFIEAKKEIRGHQLPEIEALKKQQPNLLIVAETIFPKIKQVLKEQEINYLETNGNLFIKDKGLFMLIEGQVTKNTEKVKTGRAFTKTGLRLIFHFLINEKLVNQTYREMAANTGVGFGNINIIITDLKEQGYIIPRDKQNYLLDKKKDLLDKWIIGYEQKLKPNLHIGNFRFINEKNFPNWKKVELRPDRTWWGGEPGADLLTNYLQPGKFTLFTIEKRAELMMQYKMLPDAKGNIEVYQKFWNDKLGNATVPPLLIYVDLMLTGEPRCIETAKKIWDEKLEGKF
ncbi:type IV toxin-antitoxin system AbiEi family antitoxin [Chitinophagaceae bacterium 26-R-25]|nr:type IV toxin-antitoxin system AbiEi family antitoxin [Chitinophagaceae bacterium 26-R-25]